MLCTPVFFTFACLSVCHFFCQIDCQVTRDVQKWPAFNMLGRLVLFHSRYASPLKLAMYFHLLINVVRCRLKD